MQSLYSGILVAVMVLNTVLSAHAPAETVPDGSTAFYDDTVYVRLLDGGAVTELTLQEYLTDVVLQEMPASFEEEALKAQTVAARTFTMRQMYHGGSHTEADVCGDPACCQCYLDAEEGASVYGAEYEESREKVLRAVQATDGQVLVSGDELIEAVYFSSTGGSTESAAEVWGGEVSYLQPVSSPEDHRVTSCTVTLEEFRSILPEASLEGHPAGWFGEMKHTEGGAVDTMTIGGVTYAGTTLRSRFSLKSARFTVSVDEGAVSFEVTGSGHGVGMSQYGANEMAASGSTYREILLHYYTDVELKELY